MSKLTLEQVAKLSGVSRSTVSRVINEQPNVKPEVRARVRQVVHETGYHPDPAARSLAGHRSGIMGLVIPHAVQMLFTDPYIPRLLQGITQACNAQDYPLYQVPTDIGLKEWALINKGRESSEFIDPANVAG